MVRHLYLKKGLCKALLEGIWKTGRAISSEQKIYYSSVRSYLVILFRCGLIDRKHIKVPTGAFTQKVFAYKIKPKVSETQLFKELGLNPPRTNI